MKQQGRMPFDPQEKRRFAISGWVKPGTDDKAWQYFLLKRVKMHAQRNNYFVLHSSVKFHSGPWQAGVDPADKKGLTKVAVEWMER